MSLQYQTHIHDRFKSFPHLDEKAQLLGYTFSDHQIMVIKNLISGYAHECLNIQYDDAAPTKSAIAQAKMQGAMEALEHLLTAHEELQYAMRDSSEDNSSSSND